MTTDRVLTWILAGAMGIAAMAACGSDDDGGTASNSGGTGTGASAGTGTGAGSGTGGAGGINLEGGDTGELTLSITPQDPVLNATGTPVSQPFQAVLSNGGDTSATTWEIDDVVVGTISTSGTFQSQGVVAGVATITAKLGNLSATTTVTVKVAITENPGNVTPGDQALLEAGGTADSAFRWLYPYDQTVFPRGLTPPMLQFAGAAADAMLVKISVKDFSYTGWFGASSPSRVDLPATAWKGLTYSAGGTDPVTVQVSKLSGGQATGPATETWKIAPSSLKGIVYYNTYLSKLASTGAVMRIKPGQNAEVLFGGCTVCHSVSANGTVLAAGVNWSTDNPVDSQSHDLLPDGTTTPRYLDTDGRKFSFGALTPDGAWLLSNGSPSSASPIRGLSGDLPSKLWDTASGSEVSASGFPVSYALSPSFSPDGKKLAFNRWEQGSGKTLSLVDFDGAQSPPVFSNLTDAVTAENAVAGWPSFLPDTQAVVYHDGDRFDTAAFGAQPSYAELRMVDLATKTVNKLEALNGRANGALTLPFGESEEGKLDYEPTVLPVAVGGYYWVVFTSRRVYGNTIGPGGTVTGGDNKWGTYVSGVENPSPRKKLWVAAIDVTWQGVPDPSHPAFYLPGQELEAGNMRAFAALEPCKPDGSTCESGAECCNGFCRPTAEVDDAGVPVTKCVPPPPGCSNEDEACKTAADCCEVALGVLCINGHCAKPGPR